MAIFTTGCGFRFKIRLWIWSATSPQPVHNRSTTGPQPVHSGPHLIMNDSYPAKISKFTFDHDFGMKFENLDNQIDLFPPIIARLNRGQ